MRTALLSTIEHSDEGVSRAFCMLGGRPVIEWQLDLARDLSCERIICLAERPSPQLEHFRDRVEVFDLEFQAIGGPLQLAGLVSADQDLVVIGDGVILDREALNGILNEKCGVVVIPADAGIAAGFERVDASHAWGGLLVTRGRVADGLAEMPPDSDTVSLLLRLALQARTPLVEMPEEWLDQGALMLATSNAALEKREVTLLDRSAQTLSWFGPFVAMAQLFARRLAPGGLERGPLAATGLSIGLIAGAIGLAQYARTDLAFAALALAGFMASLAIGLSALKSRLLGAMPARNIELLFNSLLDISAILLVVSPLGESTSFQRTAIALLIVGLWRLAERAGPAPVAPLWQDRSLFAVVLGVAAYFDQLYPTMQMLTLAALAYSLFFTYRARLTRA